ncbi:MAG: exodeoxyribonuclease VII small subunit [Actinobacteria bacterium]|nr:exodeoxyribonuclease VII small subunit [Actinomycetota bacterium]
MTKTNPASEIPYEDARAALTEVVKSLEAGGISLEESLALWEKGEQFAATCRTWLEGAQNRLDSAAE